MSMRGELFKWAVIACAVAAGFVVTLNSVSSRSAESHPIAIVRLQASLPAPVVDRSHKSDRNGTREAKLPFGCDPAVSALLDSASSIRHARCVT